VPVIGAIIVVAAFLFLRSRKNAEGPFVMLQPPSGDVSKAHELQRYWPVPDFSLTERSGEMKGLADLRGKVWVADFFYTTCPGTCPMLSSRLAAVQAKFGGNPEVRLVSIATDPAKDTPEALRAYAERFKAGPNWLFLTGDKQAIFDLANKGFKLSVTEERNNPEPVTHSTKLVLVDRTGTTRGFYEGAGETDDTPRLMADIERLLREGQGADASR
jgi:protein SCO1/2